MIAKRLLELSAYLIISQLRHVICAQYWQTDIESGATLRWLGQNALERSLQHLAKSEGQGCTKENVRERKEWRTIPARERKDFVAAVQCLQQRPSSIAHGLVPGAKSMFDDFAAVHLNQSAYVHNSAKFLIWHRYYTWTYEQKLREVCRYEGAFPYWEWGLDVDDPSLSPLFDGSETSIGSDGEPTQHAGHNLGSIVLAPGTGGGCVMRGPFSNMTTHLGPADLPPYGDEPDENVDDPLQDNPRCLKRDLNGDPGRRFASFRNTTSLILDHDKIEMFQAVMQGDRRYVKHSMGVHGGGHYMFGGNPGADPHLAPGDPAFFLHHAQIDRVYWIWQMQDIENRQEIFGTGTRMNEPPSPQVTVEDVIDIGPLNGPRRIQEFLSTIDGRPLCYIYI